MTTLLNDALNWIIGLVGEAFSHIIGLVVELILSVPSADLSSQSSTTTPQVPAGTSQVSQILSYTVWVALIACVAALIVAVGAWAWAAARGEPGDGAARLLKVAAGVALVSAGMAIVTGWASGFHRNPTTGPAGEVQDGLFWYAMLAMAASLIVGGVKIAWDHRGEDMRRLVGSVARFAVTSAVGVTVLALGIQAAAAFSKWMITTALTTLPTPPTDGTASAGGDAAAGAVGTAVAFSGGLVTGAAGISGGEFFAIIILIVLVISILVALVGFVIVVALNALLVVMAGVLPLASSFTFFKMGQEWFDKIVGWCIAFVLYKPAMAVIYATAFALMESPLSGGGTSPVMTNMYSFLMGVVLTAMATLALPALMRLCVPAVSAASGAGLGGMLTAVAGGAMMMKVASGAGAASSVGSDVGGGSAQASPEGAQPSPSSPAPATAPAANSNVGNGVQQVSSDSTSATAATSDGNVGISGNPAGAGAAPSGTASEAGLAATGVGAPMAAATGVSQVASQVAGQVSDAATSSASGADEKST